jgi:hypothetical protein
VSVTNFSDASKFNSKNIRKALEAILLLKPRAAADAPVTKIWSVTSGLIIPQGYEHVGWCTKKDAYTFARDTDKADVESHGSAEPTRSDLTKDITTLKFVMQESKRQVIGIYEGQDLSAITPSTDGNIVYDKPSRPQSIDYRGLLIAKDGDGANAIYFARWMPLCRVTDVDDQTWGEEDEVQYGSTLTAFQDPTVKTAVRTFWAGPGVDPVAMGFKSA